MIRLKNYTFLFALGVSIIALGYSVWMFICLDKPDRMPFTLAATLVAPIGAFFIASLCWHVAVEKFHFHYTLVGIIIGAASGWSMFASGLLAASISGVLIGDDSLRTIEAMVLLVKLAVGFGPLFLIAAWGWIPLVLCMLFGAFCIRSYRLSRLK